MRRMRARSNGDYFEYRYDSSVAALYTLVGVGQLTVNIGLIQLGAGAMIEGITDGAIHRNVAIVAMTIMFMLYGIAGGLAAAIVTDFVQGILTVVLSFILLPFALDAVGGFAGLHREIADESMFSLVAPGEINGFWIFILGINSLIGILTHPPIMAVSSPGRTAMAGRFSLPAAPPVHPCRATRCPPGRPHPVGKVDFFAHIVVMRRFSPLHSVEGEGGRRPEGGGFGRGIPNPSPSPFGCKKSPGEG